ncbi:hypothetical protein [Aquibacillus halophilus]|nr:hypothetical protein [Aquibacillus halophilus]
MVISSIGAVGAGVVSYLVVDKKWKKILNTFKKRSNINDDKLPLEQAGVPEVDNEENAKMVSEGSQFGVNYYNEVKEDK